LGKNTGLSPTPLSSISTCERAYASASCAVPITCGVERMEYASCTLHLILPSLRSPSLTNFSIAFALFTAPVNPRALCNLTVYGLMFAFNASRDIAAAISACFNQLFASYRKMALIAVRRLEPLMMANPSLALNPGIEIPALSMASFPSRSLPL